MNKATQPTQLRLPTSHDTPPHPTPTPCPCPPHRPAHIILPNSKATTQTNTHKSVISGAPL